MSEGVEDGKRSANDWILYILLAGAGTSGLYATTQTDDRFRGSDFTAEMAARDSSSAQLAAQMAEAREDIREIRDDIRALRAADKILDDAHPPLGLMKDISDIQQKTHMLEMIHARKGDLK